MKISLRAIPALLLGVGAVPAFAAGFQLLEQNASGLGNAYAGSAAVAEDASTIYFNPAGLAALQEGKHVVIAVNAITPSSTLQNGSSLSASGVTSYTYAGFGGDAGGTSFVPNAYFAMSLAPSWTLGLGINAPFGLKTQYDDNWIGRFQAIKSELKTVNINPTLAWKLNDKVSLGFGLDWQKIDATLTKAVNYTAIVGRVSLASALAIGNVEGRNDISGGDSAWGYNLGALFQVSESMRIGLAYRSAIHYALSGTHTATHPVTGNPTADAIIAGNPSTQNQAVSLDLTVPDSFTTSVVQRLNDKWDMLGDVSWTGWAKIPEIRVRYSVAGAADEVTTYHFRNTWRVALGANYRYADNLKFRFGIAYDQTPVRDEFRTPRLPDSSRTWFATGLQYKPGKDSAIDLGLAYLKGGDAPINNSGEVTANARGLLNGNYDNSVRILSAQYSMNF